MFNTKRIKELEKEVGIGKHHWLDENGELETLAEFVLNESKVLSGIIKRLKALEKHLNLEWKVTPAKEGYEEKKDWGITTNPSVDLYVDAGNSIMYSGGGEIITGKGRKSKKK